MVASLVLILSAPVHAALSVVTTTEDLASIARSIGGDRITVTSLTRGSADPHFAVAKPSMIRRVYSADLLVLVGAEIEVGWLPALLKSARNSKVLPGNAGYLDLSEHVTLKGAISGPIDRSMGDVHARGNPHYWLDPYNGIKMATAIKNRLGELDTENKPYYETRLDQFNEALLIKLKDWQARMAPLSGMPVIAYHTSFIYLAEAFDFRIVDEVEPRPGISPSAAALGKLVEHIRQDHIELLIMEPWYERRSSQWLQEQTGIKVAVIPQSVNSQAGIEDYFSLFDTIVLEMTETRSSNRN